MGGRKDQTSQTNPLHGRSKEHTREQADHADPTEPRTPVDETVTGQGGSHKGGSKGRDAHSRHPSEHGGVKHDLPEHPRPTRRQRGQRGSTPPEED